MPEPVQFNLHMAQQMASNTARVGWFYGINRLLANCVGPTRRQGSGSRTRPVPTRAQMFAELRRLVVDDARDASRGFHAGNELNPARIGAHVGRLRAMMRDLPGAAARRERGVFDTAKEHAASLELPDYYAQDFHFQTGGHLTEESAQLYDVQVETLFYGSGDMMRRAAMRPIGEFMQGRDQRSTSLLDVACGTGRFLRGVRLAYPRMALTGLDLSPAYLEEARRHFGRLREAAWSAAAAEAMPQERASQDIVTSIYLFHELPGEVRRAVAAEIARVLKPGGLFVMVDSLQFGDRPGWDGLLEAFPERFHEPFYRQYLIDDLNSMFAGAGLELECTRVAFMSKVLAFRKPE